MRVGEKINMTNDMSALYHGFMPECVVGCVRALEYDYGKAETNHTLKEKLAIRKCVLN